MAISEYAKEYCDKAFGEKMKNLKETDPEFVEFFENFAFDDVVRQNDLDEKTRHIAILATLIGCQGIDAYREMVGAALQLGISPVAIKEIVYQATAYLGIGRVLPFLTATNEIFAKEGIALPLAPQSTTEKNTRLKKGEQAQIDIFGEGMRGFSSSGAEGTRHINRWLTENCFGDYYTRGGLDYRQREMITFCFLSAQGGCEMQLISHAKANMRIGNNRAFLIKVVSQVLPYIGYPRSLNALRCISEAEK